MISPVICFSTDQVRTIEWSLDDSRLVSCGTDGAVYEWNTQTGKRETECILKSCSYTGVAFSSDYKTILAVGTDLTLKEIQDCQASRTIRTKAHLKKMKYSTLFWNPTKKV